MGIVLGQRKKILRKTAELKLQLKKRKSDALNHLPAKKLKQQSEYNNLHLNKIWNKSNIFSTVNPLIFAAI